MSQVIMRAMSVKIEDRYQTVEAMREALLAGEGQNAQMEPYVIPASRISKRDLPKKRGFLIGVAFCIVIMLVVTGIWMAGRVAKKAGTATATEMNAASTEAQTATMADAQTATDAEQAATEAEKTTQADNPMVMHVPTKEELAEQEKSDAILNITSSETERVSIDAFEYMKDGNQGYRMESADGLAAVAYEGDCVKLCLKYYDSILGDTPQVTDDLIYSYTFERYDSDYGIYRAIYDAMIHRVTGTMQLYIRQSFILQMIPLHCIFRLLRGWRMEGTSYIFLTKILLHRNRCFRRQLNFI